MFNKFRRFLYRLNLSSNDNTYHYQYLYLEILSVILARRLCFASGGCLTRLQQRKR